MSFRKIQLSKLREKQLQNGKNLGMIKKGKNLEDKGGIALEERKQYLRLGLTLFLTACAILVFYDTFYMGGTLQSFTTKLIRVLAPVLYGFVMAYLLAPIVNWLERVLTGEADRALKGKKKAGSKRWLRALSILLTWAFVILLVYLLMVMLIPQLVDSITMLVNNAENYYNKIYDWASGLFKSDSETGSWAASLIDQYYDVALDYLKSHILPWAQSMITSLTGGIWSGIWGVVSFLKNTIVGIIVSVYMLAMKERSAARCAKLIYGVFREDRAQLIIKGTRKVDEIFSGFVRGKLLDSLIIGILCFIGCSILKLPYTPLVSDRGRHQRDPLLRPLHRRRSQRLPDPAGQPRQVSVFHHLRRDPPAAGRQRHRPQDPGGLHRHLQLLGGGGHSGGRRLRRPAGHVPGRARVRLSPRPAEIRDRRTAAPAEHAHGGIPLRGKRPGNRPAAGRREERIRRSGVRLRRRAPPFQKHLNEGRKRI